MTTALEVIGVVSAVVFAGMVVIFLLGRGVRNTENGKRVFIVV